MKNKKRKVAWEWSVVTGVTAAEALANLLSQSTGVRPSSVEDSDRDPASHELVLCFNGLWRHLQDERAEDKIFVHGETNNRRQSREEAEVKDWKRMERMAAAIKESTTHTAEHLQEVVESLRNNDLGSGAPNAESWAEQAKIHDRMIQVGMIFAAAGAHLVGMAETTHRDKFHRKHLLMSGEIEDDGRRVVVCPDCGNKAVPRSDDSSHTF